MLFIVSEFGSVFREKIQTFRRTVDDSTTMFKRRERGGSLFLRVLRGLCVKIVTSNLHTNILLFRKKLQRLESTLPAYAAILYAAERRAKISEQPAVHPHDSGLERRRYAMRSREVFGPDRR